MGINFYHVLLSCIAFGAGFYIKARFEINQEQLIKKLQLQIETIKQAKEKKIEKLKYQLWEVEQARDRLNRDFLEFKEKAKTGSFNSITKEEMEIKASSNALKSFL